jgi:hypothetical protein
MSALAWEQHGYACQGQHQENRNHEPHWFRFPRANFVDSPCGSDEQNPTRGRGFACRRCRATRGGLGAEGIVPPDRAYGLVALTRRKVRGSLRMAVGLTCMASERFVAPLAPRPTAWPTARARLRSRGLLTPGLRSRHRTCPSRPSPSLDPAGESTGGNATYVRPTKRLNHTQAVL